MILAIVANYIIIDYIIIDYIIRRVETENLSIDSYRIADFWLNFIL